MTETLGWVRKSGGIWHAAIGLPHGPSASAATIRCATMPFAFNDYVNAESPVEIARETRDPRPTVCPTCIAGAEPERPPAKVIDIRSRRR